MYYCALQASIHSSPDVFHSWETHIVTVLITKCQTNFLMKIFQQLLFQNFSSVRSINAYVCPFFSSFYLY